MIAGRMDLERRARFRRYQAHHFRWLQHLVSATIFGADLRALALFYGTDKGTTHRYVDVYNTFFHSIRRRCLGILEIGVGGDDDPYTGGGSLRMWRTYFPRARIFAIDVLDKRPHQERRIKIFRGSQDDADFLNKVADEIGQLDVVIDDGSHIPRHVRKTFDTLFRRLAPGGLYVVEDVHCSYWDGHEGASQDLDRPDTTMNYFRRLVDGVNAAEIQKVNKQYAPSEIERLLYSLSFYEKLIVVQKAL
jgi:hypothetical protein